MDANSELADPMLAEYRAFEEYYRFRNSDPETLQEKLEAWWAAVKYARSWPQSVYCMNDPNRRVTWQATLDDENS
jgi:hypothetical protein